MSTTIHCPNCAKRFKVEPNAKEKQVRCPKCREIIGPEEPAWLAYKWVIVGGGAVLVLCGVLLYFLFFSWRDYAAGAGNPKSPKLIKDKNGGMQHIDGFARHRMPTPAEPV
jgi:hypothetical protein